MKRIKNFGQYSVNEELSPELRNAAALKAAKLATKQDRDTELKYGKKNTFQAKAYRELGARLSSLPNNIIKKGKRLLEDIFEGSLVIVSIKKYVLDTDPLKNGPNYGMKIGQGADAYIEMYTRVHHPRSDSYSFSVRVLPDDIQITDGEDKMYKYTSMRREVVDKKIYDFCKRYLQPELKFKD